MQHRDCLKDLRILIVDDDKDTREMLSHVLKLHGATAIPAENVSQALDAIPQQKPDLIITDIGMPGFNGFALVGAIRKSDEGDRRNLPVIALTGYPSNEDRSTALSLGFDEYLEKPFEPGELVSTIERLHQARNNPV